MIRLVIFDLDGVLVSSKDAHFHALNDALAQVAPEFVISMADHLSHFDGLPTARKLDLLERRGLSPSLKSGISKLKQDRTPFYLEQIVFPNDETTRVFRFLRENGVKVHVASNSVRRTTEGVVQRLGLAELVDNIMSNEDVQFPKPNPEMYLRCMIKEGVGRQAVFQSGALLCPVNRPSDVTVERVRSMIESEHEQFKWKDSTLNVLIPMAGAGSRFKDAGYTFPKPLIEVGTKPMIQVVVESLKIEAKYVYIVQKAHYEQYNLKFVLNAITPNCEIVQVDGLTEGAACTTLLAKQYIDNDHQLLVANSDQWIEWDSSDFMYAMQNDRVDGGVLSFESTHPKWSYAAVTENGVITDIQEKKPISSHATVGIYYWKRGSDYVKYAEQMIARDLRVNNEFYVAPVYNEAIADGKIIKNYRVKQMMGLGTPADLQVFLQSEAS